MDVIQTDSEFQAKKYFPKESTFADFYYKP